MADILPSSVREELAAAQKAARRKASRRSVHVGDVAYPILGFREDGFDVDVGHTPRMRGLVDIFDGPRHLYQALIVASEQQGDVMRYEFKRNTPAATKAAVDFEQAPDRPVGLLPRH